ncbi:MAG: GtrA family protein [bacterium]|nr:GtrA family protein [bacterium]
MTYIDKFYKFIFFFVRLFELNIEEESVRQLVKHNVSGVITASINFTIFNILFHVLADSLKSSIEISNGIAILVSIIVGFIIQRNYTFKSTKKIYSQVVAFVLVAFLYYLIETTFLYGMIVFLKHTTFSSKMLSLIFLMPINFYLQKNIIFHTSDESVISRIVIKIKKIASTISPITYAAIAFALFNLLLWYFLAAPYSIFPSDDKYHHIKIVAATDWHGLLHTRYPVLVIVLKMFSAFWKLFGFSNLNQLLMSTLVASSISVFFIGKIAHLITRNKYISIVSMILFIISSWTANYYFMHSYTVYCNFIFLSIIYLITYRYLKHSDQKNNGLFMLLAGVLVGVLFWSTPSSPMLLFFIGLYFLILLKSKRYIILMAIGFLLVFFIFGESSLIPLLSHYKKNIFTDHYTIAYAKFGYVPLPPYFVFFYILFYYNPVISILLYLSSAILLFTTCKNKISGKNISDEVIVITTSISIICVSTIIMTFLPFTKLGHTLYQFLPIVIIIVPSSLYLIVKNINLALLRNSLTILLTIAFCASVFLQISQFKETIIVRKAFPEFLSKHNIDNKNSYYLLHDDPHGMSIYEWSGQKLLKLIHLKDIKKILNENENNNEKFFLVIGPRGLNSARISILHNKFTTDLYLKNITDVLSQYKISYKIYKYIPYYSAYPPFLFEEEVLQAQYFEKKSNQYNAKSQQILILELN